MRLSLSGRELFAMLAFATGTFSEGYATVSISFVVAGLSAAGMMSTAEASLCTGLFLAGCFFGAPLLGALGDACGRRRLSLATITAIMLLGAAAAAGASVPLLAVVQFFLGAALGGDIPNGMALAAEAVSPENRQRVLSALMLIWFGGALAGVPASFILPDVCGSWSGPYWVLAAVGAAGLLMRLGVPEAASGGKAEASGRRATLREILSGRSRRAVAFCCAFWLCQAVPAVAMTFYAPSILQSMTGSADHAVHVALLYGFFAIGVLPSMFFQLLRRLPAILFATFVLMSAGLAAFAVAGGSSPAVVGAAFVVYAFAYGLQSSMVYVCPNVLVPAAVRSTAMGIVTSVVRLGSAASAFALPFLLEAFGPPAVLVGGAAICILGAATAFLVPEHAGTGG